MNINMSIVKHPLTRALVASLFLFSTILETAALALGTMSFKSPGYSQPLLRSGIRTHGFRAKVGGVAFSQIAESADGWVIKNVEYDAQANDGTRLIAEFSKTGSEEIRKIPLPFHDWIIVPTARFAIGKNEACFTLFGNFEERHSDAEVKLRDEGYRIVSYHPAFKDTLLGLRLMQSDILILTDDAADLPKDDEVEGSPYILGAGENTPDLDLNLSRLSQVSKLLQEYESPFTSYIVSDIDETISYSLGNNFVEFQGDPVWWCWKEHPDVKASMQLAKTNQVIIILRDLLVNEGVVSHNDATKMEELQLIEKFENLDEDAQGRLAEKLNTDLTTWMTDSFEKDYVKLLHGAEESIEMPNFSRLLTERINRNEGVNPEVYNALRSSMQLAAFLRAYQKADEEGMKRLVRNLDEVSTGPKIVTPEAIRY